MKTTLNWYKREANTYNQLGQRRLYKKYGFAGVGKFAALTDIIVTLDNCQFSIDENSEQLESLAFGLDFEEESEFISFVNDLLKFKLLVKTNKNNFSTPDIIESLAITMEERANAYFRKYGVKPNYNIPASYGKSSPELEQSSPELEQSSGEELKNNPNFSQSRERERKEKIRTERESFAYEIFTKSFLEELKENFNQEEEKIINYQKEFLKNNKMMQKSWKNSGDFLAHFLNWLKIQIEKEKNYAKKEKGSHKITIQDYSDEQ